MRKPDRYIIEARWWNGHGFDGTKWTKSTIGKCCGSIETFMKNLGPYQISITDRKHDLTDVVVKRL